MNEQNNQEIIEMLKEICSIVDLYTPTKNYLLSISGLSMVIIAAVVICTVGVFWGIILIAATVIPIILYVIDGFSIESCYPSEEKLSERACDLMCACVKRCENPNAKGYILVYGETLYEEFISFFPEMASKKLKRLSSIHLRGCCRKG
jgi:hypothetical protein